MYIMSVILAALCIMVCEQLVIKNAVATEEFIHLFLVIRDNLQLLKLIQFKDKEKLLFKKIISLYTGLVGTIFSRLK